ncbi:MAG: hypothetical protein WCA32_03745 [Chromatiaceae bacterium]
MSLSVEDVQKGLAPFPWAARVPAGARELTITDADKKAAWELYVELVTRVATQPLGDEDGVEATALESIASLFPLVRKLMRQSGPGAAAFSALTITLLNYRVRPFTAAWHKRSADGRLSDPAISGRFRDELRALQQDLRAVADVLADLIQVPRLSDYSAP